MGGYNVYILRSIHAHDCFYVGFTEDLHERLNDHNSRRVPHTSKYAPWKIKTAIAFEDRRRALDFERYLKSASGRAFTRKRL